MNKDEQWLLDLFTVAQRRSLSPKQIVNLWESVFPHRKLSCLRDAVKSLKQRRLVETTESGALLFVGEGAGDHSRLGGSIAGDAGGDAL